MQGGSSRCRCSVPRCRCRCRSRLSRARGGSGSSVRAPCIIRSCHRHNDAGRSALGHCCPQDPRRPSHGGGVSAVLTCLCFKSALVVSLLCARRARGCLCSLASSASHPRPPCSPSSAPALRPAPARQSFPREFQSEKRV